MPSIFTTLAHRVAISAQQFAWSGLKEIAGVEFKVICNRLSETLNIKKTDVKRKTEKMNIDFKRLSEVEKSEIIELMNNPLVRRHMPLARDNFGKSDCDEFVTAKEQLWSEHGYGPWAFVVDGQFVGWGGLQPECGDADLGLVLHPNYWGIGKALYDEIIGRAFGEMGFESVTVLLPPTRKRVKGLLRLGFEEDGELLVGDQRFNRYRLKKATRGI